MKTQCLRTLWREIDTCVRRMICVFFFCVDKKFDIFKYSVDIAQRKVYTTKLFHNHLALIKVSRRLSLEINETKTQLSTYICCKANKSTVLYHLHMFCTKRYSVIADQSNEDLDLKLQTRVVLPHHLCVSIKSLSINQM